jgi:hypothetical protein
MPPHDRPFSGRTYPKLARIVRALCAVAGRCCLRWLLLLLSPLLSSTRRVRVWQPARPGPGRLLPGPCLLIGVSA